MARKKIETRGFFAKVYSAVQNAIVTIKENKSTGQYLYGRDDKFPNKLLDVVSDSGTATSCITIKSDFISGEGFSSDVTKNLKINPYETANHFLYKISPYVATFEAVALNVQFDWDGNPRVFLIPFQTIRKNENGTFRVNPNYGTSEYKQSETLTYPPFKKGQSIEEIREMIEIQLATHERQLGQIIYCYRETPKSIHYPVPDYFSGIDDIRSDAEISKIEIENCTNGFMPSAILTLVGEVDNQTKDQNGLTDQQKLDDALMSFTGAKGGRNRLALLTAKTKDAVPVLQSYDAKAMFDAINGATDRLARKTCRHMGVPPILIGLSTAGQLGNNQELANYMELFTFSVKKYQSLIIEALKEVFPTIDWSIAPLQLLKYLPDYVLNKLTDDEVRELGGYAPVPQAVSQSADRTINAINSLSPLVANKVLESLSRDEIRNLVGLSPTEQPTLEEEIVKPETVMP